MVEVLSAGNSETLGKCLKNTAQVEDMGLVCEVLRLII